MRRVDAAAIPDATPTGGLGVMDKRTKFSAVAVASALALSSVAALTGLSPTAQAADEHTATIVVSVGGVRQNSTTVAGLQGVNLQLNAVSRNTIGAPLADPWATCESQSNGDCTFTIPDTQFGGANYDRRFFVTEKTPSPTGWYPDSTIETSSDYPNKTYAVQTGPRLREGQTYSSADFPATTTGGRSSSGTWAESMDDPALPASCGLNVALIMDMSYSVQQAGAQQTLKDSASGLTNALVGTNSQVALFTFGRNAPAMGYVNANRPLTPVSTQAGADKVNAWIDGMIIPGGPGSGGIAPDPESTNWDRGLYQVAEQQNEQAANGKLFDVALIITDGGPTRYSPAALGNGVTTRFAEVEQAVFSANAIKAQGTRVIAIGVGSDVAGYAPNLRAISGPVENQDYYTVGWDQAAATLKSLALSGCIVTPPEPSKPANSSLTLIKQVLPSTWSSGDPLTDAAVQPGWDMTASTEVGKATIGATPDATTVTANGTTAAGTGATGFSVGYPVGSDPTVGATISIDEKVKNQTTDPALTGYSPADIDGQGGSAVCTWLNAPAGTSPVLTTTPTGSGTSTISLKPGQIASCSIYNVQPPATQPATVRVDKVWKIGTATSVGNPSSFVTYLDGSQPTGFSSSYSVTDLTDPGKPVSYSGLSWGTTYTGWQSGRIGTMTESMSLPAGCSWDASDWSQPSVELAKTGPTPGQPITVPVDLGDQSSRNVVGHNTGTAAMTPAQAQTLEAGDNTWTATNTIICVTRLLLGKQVMDKKGTANPASPWDWNLTATNTTNPDTAPWPINPIPQCADGQDPSTDLCLPVDSDLMFQMPVNVKVGNTYVLSEALNANASPQSKSYVQEIVPAAVASTGTEGSTPASGIVPGATGSWSCGEVSLNPAGLNSVYTAESQVGQITIPYDAAAMTGCVALNGTAEVNATKTIVGGPSGGQAATAADWTYSLTPTSATATPVDGTFGNPTGVGPTYPMTPMQTYTVAESLAPGASDIAKDYTLTDIRCTWTAPQWSAAAPEPSWGPSVHYDNQSIMHPPAGMTANQLTVYPGTTASCEFVNTYQEHTTLTLVKEPVGGSATPTDWTLTAAPVTPLIGQDITGPSGSASVTDATADPGTYLLSEEPASTLTPDKGVYDLTGWACVDTSGTPDPTGKYPTIPVTHDDSAGTDSVTLPQDAKARCTATNTVKSTLTLGKDVIGAAPATDWTLTATNTTNSTDTFSGVDDSAAVTKHPVALATYALTEAPTSPGTPSGYRLTGWACTDQTGASVAVADSNPDDELPANQVTIPATSDLTCVATNVAESTLTLKKSVVGGPSVEQDWTLTATTPSTTSPDDPTEPPSPAAPTPTLSGKTGDDAVTDAIVTPGVYVLGETGPSIDPTQGSYAATWTCVVDGTNLLVGNAISLDPGDNATCTVTNTWTPTTHLTLIKKVDNSAGSAGTLTETAWTLTANGPSAPISGVGKTGAPAATGIVTPGTWTLTETLTGGSAPDPSLGAYTASWACTNAKGENVAIQPGPSVSLVTGDDITCTVTNAWAPAPAATLTLVKKVDNTAGSGGGLTEAAWTLTATGPSTPITGVGKTGAPAATGTVTPGTWTLTETLTPGSQTPDPTVGSYTAQWACVDAT
ncbi:MAG: VWA domain-containing protein, partial [Propionibacteriaceae bacterium]|nr:VWA domain-containing protein [Propionibacteriaceae bacterium]